LCGGRFRSQAKEKMTFPQTECWWGQIAINFQTIKFILRKFFLQVRELMPLLRPWATRATSIQPSCLVSSRNASFFVYTKVGCMHVARCTSHANVSFMVFCVRALFLDVLAYGPVLISSRGQNTSAAPGTRQCYFTSFNFEWPCALAPRYFNRDELFRF